LRDATTVRFNEAAVASAGTPSRPATCTRIIEPPAIRAPSWRVSSRRPITGANADVATEPLTSTIRCAGADENTHTDPSFASPVTNEFATTAPDVKFTVLVGGLAPSHAYTVA
jgi:hypothetical protein